MRGRHVRRRVVHVQSVGTLTAPMIAGMVAFVMMVLLFVPAVFR